MLRQTLERKGHWQLADLWATPRAWLFAASIAWCAVLACGLAYVILIAAL
jgi:hypothetical protein